MAGFDIEFTGKKLDDDPLMAIGLIQLGGDREYFHAALGFWSMADYRASWIAALRRLVEGAELSCLLTSIVDPESAVFMTAWPLYRFGNDIYVQNRLIFVDELDHTFDPGSPWRSIGPRVEVNEDGDRISEWHIAVDDIVEFLSRHSMK